VTLSFIDNFGVLIQKNQFYPKKLESNKNWRNLIRNFRNQKYLTFSHLTHHFKFPLFNIVLNTHKFPLSLPRTFFALISTPARETSKIFVFHTFFFFSHTKSDQNPNFTDVHAKCSCVLSGKESAHVNQRQFPLRDYRMGISEVG
jgi:hypothetical protein